MKQVLVITDVDFWRKGAGHRMRILHLLEFLTQHVQVMAAYTDPAPDGLDETLSALLPVNFTLKTIPSFSLNHQKGEYLNELLNGQHFDAILIEYIHNSYFLKYLDTEDSILILDAHDIVSDRAAEFEKFGLRGVGFELSEELEFQIFDLFDHILVLNDLDREKINSILASPKAALCSYPSPVQFHPIRNKVENIGFIASEYHPNIDAIRFFMEDCWPPVAARHDVQLSVYGNVCKKLPPPQNSNIVLKGYVPDLQAIYAEVDLIVNPVRFGAGLKIKNVEALANGIPLLTTTHGARGLEAGKDKAFLVADDPADIIDALYRLLENPGLRRSLSANARIFIQQHFSARHCYGPLLDLITRSPVSSSPICLYK